MAGFVHSHLEIHHERYELHDSRHDAPSAGRADREPHTPSGVDHRWTHVGQRPLARAHAVGSSGSRIEPHDAVVHENTRFGQYHLGAEHREQRLGERHHVAVGVDHAHMRGAGGRGALAVVAEIFQALGIGLQQTVRVAGVRGGVGRRPWRHALAEQLEGSAQGRGTGQLGRAVHERTPVAKRLRGRDGGVVPGEVCGGDAAAQPLEVTHQLPGDPALVEIPCAGLGQALQAGGQISEPHARHRSAPFTRRHVPAGQIDACALHVVAQLWRRGGNLQRRVPVDLHASPCELDGRRQALAPAAAAEALERRRHTVGKTGHGEREGSDHVALVEHRGPAEQIGVVTGRRGIVIRVEGERCAHAEIHVIGAPLVGQVDEHVAAATESAHPGLHRADGEGGGNRGIHGVAALGEHPSADSRGLEVLAHHNSGRRFHGGLAYVPGLGIPVHQVVAGHALVIRLCSWKMAPLSGSDRRPSPSDGGAPRAIHDAPLHEKVPCHDWQLRKRESERRLPLRRGAL